MNDFYVYAHYRKSDGRIFYIGKGRGFRYKSRDPGSRNQWWLHTVEKHGLVAKKIVRNVSEETAFDIEKKMIAFYGRADLGQGPLVNLTDGGEIGATGRVLTDRERKNLSRHAKRRMSDPAVRRHLRKMAIKQFSDPDALTRHRLQAKKRFSKPENNTRYDHKKYRFVNKENEDVVYKTKYEMREMLGVGTSEISALVNGKRKSCRGWCYGKIRERSVIDQTIYTFVHDLHGVRKYRRIDLKNEFQEVECSALTLLVQGKLQSTKGWRLA